MSIIKDAIDRVLQLAHYQRPTLQPINDGSGRILVFDEGLRRYEEIEPYNLRKRAVSNIESFAAMVLEEARRANDSDGNWMTVVFTALGGKFHLNDSEGRTVFDFERQLSPQWQLLAEEHEELEHRQFLHLLARLRPSIPEYPTVQVTYRKVTLGRGATVDSAPQLVDGVSGMYYSVEVQVTGGLAKAALPTAINFRLPFGRGSAKQYDLQAELIVELVEKEKSVQFSLTVPDMDTVAEQAVADEVAWFREKVQSLPKLHILEDY